MTGTIVMDLCLLKLFIKNYFYRVIFKVKYAITMSVCLYYNSKIATNGKCVDSNVRPSQRDRICLFRDVCAVCIMLNIGIPKNIKHV